MKSNTLSSTVSLRHVNTLIITTRYGFIYVYDVLYDIYIFFICRFYLRRLALNTKSYQTKTTPEIGEHNAR